MRNQATITNTRPIPRFAVRIHKPQSRHAGEPMVILSPSNRTGYYLAVSLSQGTGREIREVHRSCLLRTPESIKIARRINRKANRKASKGMRFKVKSATKLSPPYIRVCSVTSCYNRALYILSGEDASGSGATGAIVRCADHCNIKYFGRRDK